MYYHHGQIQMFIFTCSLEEHLLTFFVQKQQSCYFLSWFEPTVCTNNVCEINVCSGTFRWEVGIHSNSISDMKNEELSPQTLSSSYKLWKIMAHEFSYPAKGKPLWSHKWSGAFWLVASFEWSCFVVVPKKVITAMSGKYCCWYYYCATNILCFTLGFISTSG